MGLFNGLDLNGLKSEHVTVVYYAVTQESFLCAHAKT